MRTTGRTARWEVRRQEAAVRGTVWALTGLALLAAGCGGPARARSDASTEPEGTEPPVKSVRATGSEITVNSKDGKSSFVVRSDSAMTEMGKDSVEAGRLAPVTGEIRRGGARASRFAADVGRVDAGAKVFELEGNVRFTDESRGLLLRARTVRFEQSKDRIIAKGAVTVTSEVMTMGPLDELWATPDLSRIATPGKFQ